MDDPIEYDISNGVLTDYIIPACHGQLTGYDSRFSTMPVIGNSEYTTFGNYECSKNGNNGAAFLAIRNAA